VGVEGFAPVPCARALPENFPTGNIEVRLQEAVPPEQLEFFELEDMLTRIKLASLNARKKLENIRKTAAR
jgi:hypothetical protein